ncbi:MAG: HNH endonuclease signature motif containing protein [Pseudonocardiaceae bacterium]
MRDALGERDQGCAFPACGRPPRYCEAHHIVSWLDGGETKLHNMCLLCDSHHTIVHRQGWHIRLDARGHPEITPPQSIDPTTTPLHDPLRQ